uniref:Cytochrome b n=1 Tax=Syndesmis kurakaikina TaxID=2711315 RepID=A0A7G5XUK5_9PLAT|nr:cytochrome b [Syndesmis kurakaikina]
MMFILMEQLYLPTPRNISYNWNFGSLLMSVLGIQIVSGFLLTLYFIGSWGDAFNCVDNLIRELNSGGFIRYIHMAGGSLMFMFFFFHIGRNLIYGWYQQIGLWFSGCLMLILGVMVGFLGYVLPWGQMSYWAATVITNFCSVIPFIGEAFVCWIWGGFSVSEPTLIRFFSLHYLCPLLILVLVGMHIILLHENGSSNPLGISSRGEKFFFAPYYIIKDILGISLGVGIFWLIFFYYDNIFMECQNAIEANVLVTPPHIQPEWYYLAAYAVLRGIPNKFGGVLGLIFFVFILAFLPFLKGFGISSKLIWWSWFINFFWLTWLGCCVVEHPFVVLSQISSILYFLIV